VQLPASSDLLTLLGKNDELLRALELQFDLRVSARGHELTLRGEERQVAQAERLLHDLVALQGARPGLSAGEVRAALRLAGSEPGTDVRAVLGDAISVPSRRRLISPKTVNQKKYIDAIRAYDLVISIGPAGTG